MKVEIEIGMSEVQEMVNKEIAQRCIDMLWNPPFRDRKYDTESWDAHAEARELHYKNARQKIIDKINWKDAPKEISESALKEFFQRIFNGRM